MKILNNLKNLSDSNLLKQTQNLIQAERENLTILLHHLSEINSRRLYCDLGYNSMYNFLAVEYKYSSDQAYRRLQAMRLLQELPEIKEQIDSGDLNLTNLSLVNKFFKEEQKAIDCEISKEYKLKVIEKIKNKSTRETEKITLELLSNPEVLNHKLKQPDQIKSVTNDKIELKFLATKELEEKIERIKGLLAHSKPEITLGEVFEYLCDSELKKLEPKKPKDKKLEPKKPKDKKLETKKPKDKKLETKNLKLENPEDKNPNAFCKIKLRKLITLDKNKFGAPKNNLSQKVKLQIKLSQGSTCENCKSTYALEIDHRQPRALGGTHHISNLRLLCKSCNQRAAIKSLGHSRMKPCLY